jgi:hypothetical protein
MLPDSARVWVYGSEPALTPNQSKEMLEEVDRFLTIGVDQEQEGASGCSIDGLFRTLKGLEASIGGQLVTSGLVYYRGRDGQIRAVSRDEFTKLSEKGEIDGDTEVFDLSVTKLGEWKARFRSRAADSWHKSLMSSGA